MNVLNYTNVADEKSDDEITKVWLNTKAEQIGALSPRNLKLILCGIHNLFQKNWMFLQKDSHDLSFKSASEFEVFHKSVKWFHYNKTQRDYHSQKKILESKSQDNFIIEETALSGQWFKPQVCKKSERMD